MLSLCWCYTLCISIVLLYPKTKNISLGTTIGLSASIAATLLYPWLINYDWLFLIAWFILTTGLCSILLPQAAKTTELDLGEYPLALGSSPLTYFPTASLHENVQIVGGTGTGKTHFVIKPFIKQTIHQKLGAFIYDVKSNMGRDIAYYAHQSHRRYYQFNLVEPDQSHTYNPLYGNNPGAIANRLYTALYYDHLDGEPYYRFLAEAFLRNLIGLLKTEIQTLTFQDLFLATQEADTLKTISWFCAQHPRNIHSQYFREQWLSKPAKERRRDLSGLVNKLQRFCSSEWAHLLNVRDPDIQMEKIFSQDQILLFSPDSARYPEDAKALSILAMMDMAEQLSNRYRSSNLKPFRVFLDEFYNLAYPRFIDFINKCREAKINLFLAHQSLGDLKGISNEFLEQVMNTASNKIVLRINDPDTALSFARQFGTVRSLDSTPENLHENGRLKGHLKPPMEIFRFHPDRIKELMTGNAIIRMVGKTGIHIHQTDLCFATKAPEVFNPHANLMTFKCRSETMENSVIELMEKHPVRSSNWRKKFDALGD